MQHAHNFTSSNCIGSSALLDKVFICGHSDFTPALVQFKGKNSRCISVAQAQAFSPLSIAGHIKYWEGAQDGNVFCCYLLITPILG